MRTLLEDFRFATRTLRRAPGFALVAVLTLGLGIGAATSLFGVVHGVLLRALPYAEPERLVRIHTVSASERRSDLDLSPANFASLRAESAFTDVVLHGVTPTDPATLAGVVLVLVGTVLLASLVPARRAAAVEPTAALRHE